MTYAYSWQTNAHRILGKLISDGHEHGLPPLCWTLATTGALTGEAQGLGVTIEEQRAAFTAWATHLGTKTTETARSDGRVSLHAFIDHGGERVGALRAEILPGLNDETTTG
ncbi:hypothetical protein ACFY2J_40070 [Streptomyces collinus]|uniref:hypothetical protein n=1 Tax=Streptomyces collinus TaxID=42684 RepID=UPI0036C097DC